MERSKWIFKALQFENIFFLKTDNTYPKSEKLKSKKSIDTLFSRGKSIKAFPLRAVYIKSKTAECGSINVGVVVAKKNIKLAVNRNLIKRRMREAYRLNNHALKTALITNGESLNVMLIYSAKEILPYATIEQKVVLILEHLLALK